MSEDRLATIRARLANATPGPWAWETDTVESATVWLHRVTAVVSGADLVSPVPENPRLIARLEDHPNAWDDADLIAHAPDDLAWLLSEVERLRGIEADYELLALTQRKLVEDYQWLAARCKEAEAELAECRQALDAIDAPRSEDDCSLTPAGRVLTLKNWWQDYAAATARQSERADQAEARLAECRQALADALALAKKVIGHTAPYLQEQWRLPEELVRLRAALADESVYPDAGGQT